MPHCSARLFSIILKKCACRSKHDILNGQITLKPSLPSSKRSNLTSLRAFASDFTLYNTTSLLQQQKLNQQKKSRYTRFPSCVFALSVCYRVSAYADCFRLFIREELVDSLCGKLARAHCRNNRCGSRHGITAGINTGLCCCGVLGYYNTAARIYTEVGCCRLN